jgi:hypothetical protein
MLFVQYAPLRDIDVIARFSSPRQLDIISNLAFKRDIRSDLNRNQAIHAERSSEAQKHALYPALPENRSILFNNQSIRDDIHNVGSLMADSMFEHKPGMMSGNHIRKYSCRLVLPSLDYVLSTRCCMIDRNWRSFQPFLKGDGKFAEVMKQACCFPPFFGSKLGGELPSPTRNIFKMCLKELPFALILRIRSVSIEQSGPLPFISRVLRFSF